MGAPAKGLKIVAGSIKLGGQELTGLSDRALQKIRGNRIAMIFQEPMAALNPSFSSRTAGRGGVRAARQLLRPPNAASARSSC